MAKNISIKKATAVYGVAKYSTIVIQLLISAILSRLLTPDDYGLVAVVTVFTTLFSKLSDLGLGTAVTQYKDLSKRDVQDIFVFSEYFAVGIALIFALLAYPISLFYSSTAFIPIIVLLAISVLFNSLNMIPNNLLLKEKKFFQVGMRMIVSTALSGLIAIFLAFVGAKYYALVIQSILSAVIQFLWNFFSTDVKFGLKFNYAPIKRVKNYSGNQFAYNMLNYLAQNMDNLLTGKIMGKALLAYYNKGFTLMRYPVNNIAHAVTPVLHPILSEHQDNKKYIYDEFVKIIKFMSLVGVFVTVFCFWADEEIIICFFGDQWYKAVEPFKWLSICISAQMMNALFGSIYQSLGCTKQMLHSGYFHISISLLAIVIGAFSKDISVLAIFVSGSMIIKFFIESYFLIRKSFHFSLSKFLINLLPDIIIFGVLFAIVLLIGDFASLKLWQSLFLKLAVCGIIYLVILIITKQLKYLLAVIPDGIKKKFSRKGK